MKTVPEEKIYNEVRHLISRAYGMHYNSFCDPGTPEVDRKYNLEKMKEYTTALDVMHQFRAEYEMLEALGQLPQDFIEELESEG